MEETWEFAVLVMGNHPGGHSAAFKVQGRLKDEVSMGIHTPFLITTPIGAFAAMILGAVVLAGCSVKASVTPKAGVQVEKIAETNTAAIPEFNTNGKPTKTIETPWGEKEIYDPVKDVIIKDAFKRVYDKKYESTSLYLSETARRQLGDKDVDLIFLAKNIHETDAMRLGCKLLKNYYCGGRLYFQELIHPDRWKKCSYLGNLGTVRTECEKIFMQPTFHSSEGVCTINGKLRPDMGRYPVGNNTAFTDPFTTNYIKPLTENLDWETQLQDFFSFECREWQ